MRDEAKSYLHDMLRAVDRLSEFTAGKTFSDYTRDAMLRAAVERQFEIIGEALAKLAKLDPDVASRIREYRRIIAFRNILIHGYAGVDDRLVWDIAESRLPALRADMAALLNSP